MPYEAIVESDETEVMWWVSVNGKRIGEPWLDETTVYEVRDWLNGVLTASFGCTSPTGLDDLAAALGVVELPVEGELHSQGSCERTAPAPRVVADLGRMAFPDPDEVFP